MTIYAASSIMHVALGSAHGGCGNGHSRPVVQGAPARVWALDCPPCEEHLRKDQMWSVTVSEIPETYDEKLTRADFEKRGVLDERALMAMALAKLTGIDLPDTLKSRITGAVPDLPEMLECPNGHQVLADAKFCGECGAQMHVPELPAARGGDDLASLTVKDLRALAKDRGVDASGSKADILGRLLQEA